MASILLPPAAAPQSNEDRHIIDFDVSALSSPPSSPHPSSTQSHVDHQDNESPGLNSMVPAFSPPTPAPDSNEDDFSSDILQLNEDDHLYMEDEEDF